MATQTVTEGKDENGKKDERVFRSKLGDGLSRFLAHVIENGLETARRTPEDFIRHFPPMTIMKALEGQPELRANILVITTGIRPKVALKKPAESCGVDLQIALDEDEADAETIVTLFDPDDRVRYLEHAALWRFITEGDFWKADKASEPQKHERAAKHAELLPRAELEKVLTAALQSGRSKKPFVDRDFLSATPTSMLVNHVPLPWLWDHVVVPRVAEARKLVASAAPKPASAPAPVVSAPAPAPEPKVEAAPEEKPETTETSSAADDLDIGVDEIMDMVDDKKRPGYTPGPPGGTRK
jgi:hypothetical protein